MTLAPGSQLGPYEILGRLGAGAMGEVYRARDSRLGREIALKILPAEFAESSERRRRFEQESRAAGSLNHPNIVVVYEAGTEQSVAYMATELVDGESLRDAISRGLVPTRRVLEICAQVADGLAAAHAAGVVHRDIKPENVMLTRDGRPKILDFGLARVQAPSNSEATVTVTQPGAVMGTAAYMSPEQVMGAPADARSDIFSLGTMLFEMLSGKLPFERATGVETMSAILRDDPPELPASVPPALQQVVQHCLEKEPARRYQSAQDLAFSLRANSGSHISLGGAAQVAPRKRRAWLWQAVFGVLVIALTSVVAMFLRQPAGQDLSLHRFTPFATESNLQTGAVWSPDGRNVAYVHGVTHGDDEIMVRSVDSPVPARVAKANNPSKLFWSPDSQRVFFLTGAGLCSVSRAGGAQDTVLKGSYDAATISPDGKSLVVWLIVGEKGGSEPKLWISSPPGAAPRPYQPVVFQSIGSFSPVYLKFAPDGRQILLSLPRGSGTEVWLLPFPDGGKPRRILEKVLASTETPSISWMPDSRHFVFSYATSANPQPQLWRADTRSETIEALTSGEETHVFPSVSPDGKRIAFDSRTHNFDIVELPIGGDGMQSLIATTRNETFPAWSPVGGQLAFVTDRSGAPEIWLKSVQEGWERPLVTARDFPDDPTLTILTPAFSPDGTRLAYSRTSKGHLAQIWISPAVGGTPVPLTGNADYEIGPSWSPDGSWIVYFSTEGGVVKTRVGSKEKPISFQDDGCENPPQWSPDGQWIACAQDGSVTLFAPDGKQQRKVGNRKAFVTWSRDSKQLYALGRDAEGHWKLGTIDIGTGTEKILSDFGADIIFSTVWNPSFPLSLSPDGKRLATTVLNLKSDIWLFEGFR